MLASGGIVSRGNLRALNQSVSSQVAALLRSSDKAVQRTALSGTDRPHVLCVPSHWQAPAASVAERRLQQADEAGIATDSALTGAAELDNETFDDAEFYAQLLKEFLEASGSAGPGLVHTAQARTKSVLAQAIKPAIAALRQLGRVDNWGVAGASAELHGQASCTALTGVVWLCTVQHCWATPSLLG